ncbi:MAG: ribosome-binding factor A [Candidatus Pacebacteria bacterium]|nr:ribosome-binding factor A [Candidatus Paceibacterota bacterium]
MAFRSQKITEQIKHLASAFLAEQSNGQALLTVTDVSLSDDEKNALILFTVFPEKNEKAALGFVKRKRSEFKHYVKSKSKLGRVPFFDFSIDGGEKNRQLIDKISNQI